MKLIHYKMQRIFVAIIVLVAVSLQASAEGKITLTFGMEDSVKQVTATVTKTGDDGATVPVKDAEVTLYAKKSFGMLPLADAASTDEEGKVSAPFPDGLPGDEQGNVTVVAKIEDNEAVGTLEASQSVKWGKPVPAVSPVFEQRALWASGSNAPLPLTIIVTGMVVGAWGVIVYILTLLIKIKKTGTYETQKSI